MDRITCKEKAKSVLRTRWGYLVKIVLLSMVLTFGFISFNVEYTNTGAQYTTTILNFSFPFHPSDTMKLLLVGLGVVLLFYYYLVSTVLKYGKVNIFKKEALGIPESFSLFTGFRENYKKVVQLNFMMDLKVLMYTLLLIIPGLIKGYEYRFANEILEEHPDWDYKEILAESSRITMGHKLDLFVMDLSFIGWLLVFGVLDMFTLGLATRVFDIYPTATNAEAYLALKEAKLVTY